MRASPPLAPSLVSASTLYRASGFTKFKAPIAGGVDSDGWTITLCDLTLLLLGFAVMWYFTAIKQEPASTTSFSAASPAPTVQREPAHPVEVESGLAPWRKLEAELAEYFSAVGWGKDATVESKPGEILLSLRDSVPFDSGKAELRPHAKSVLEKIIVTVLAHPQLTVAIAGHTDNRRIANARFPSNWELSTARAIRVARHFVERGLPPSRIAVQGFADHRPLQPNSTSANRKTNRRVEIRLIYDQHSRAREHTELTSEQP